MSHVVRFNQRQLRAVIELLRPFTLLAPVIVSSCVMIASFFYTKTGDFSIYEYLYFVFPASISFALLNGASNILNQATDFTEDAISKPYRPIPRGIISRRYAFFLSGFFYCAALGLAVLIHPIFSMIVFGIMVFSMTYSVFPRMKQYLFFNQLWVAIPRGFLAILASWSVFSNPFDILPITIGGIAALFLFGGTTTKDILDAEADRKAGTRTLVNVYGVLGAARISSVFMIGAFLLIIPFVILGILPLAFVWLTFLVVCSGYIAYMMTQCKMNECFENTEAWRLMYGTYFLFAVSFAFLVICCV